MGPEDGVQHSAYSKVVPPAFDDHTSFEPYQQDVELWLLLTTLVEENMDQL